MKTVDKKRFGFGLLCAAGIVVATGGLDRLLSPEGQSMLANIAALLG